MSASELLMASVNEREIVLNSVSALEIASANVFEELRTEPEKKSEFVMLSANALTIERIRISELETASVNDREVERAIVSVLLTTSDSNREIRAPSASVFVNESARARDMVRTNEAELLIASAKVCVIERMMLSAFEIVSVNAPKAVLSFVRVSLFEIASVRDLDAVRMMASESLTDSERLRVIPRITESECEIASEKVATRKRMAENASLFVMLSNSARDAVRRRASVLLIASINARVVDLMRESD